MLLLCKGAVFSTLESAVGIDMSQVSGCLYSEREANSWRTYKRCRSRKRLLTPIDNTHGFRSYSALHTSLWLLPSLMMESTITIDGGINKIRIPAMHLPLTATPLPSITLHLHKQNLLGSGNRPTILHLQRRLGENEQQSYCSFLLKCVNDPHTVPRWQPLQIGLSLEACGYVM